MTKIDCLFEFKCDKQWEDLREIDPNKLGNSDVLAGVRFCDNCEKSVYKVETEKQLEYAKNNGYCVAIPKLTRFLLGIVDEEDRLLMKKSKNGFYVSTGVLKRKR